MLPFNGLSQPDGIAVGSDGSVYVTDHNTRQVLKLPAGSTSQVVLSFTGLSSPGGVAVDAVGSVYVAYGMDARIVKLAAG